MNYSSNVCDELLQVLKYIKQEDREKIPKDVINYLYSNCNSEPSFIYNQALPLKDQKLLIETSTALQDFGKKYWGWDKVM